MDQLEKIFAEEKKVLFGEETITIKTFRVKDVSTIAKIMGNVFQAIEKEKVNNQIDQSTLVKTLMSIFANQSESILNLIASSTGLNVGQLEDLSLSSITFLIKHIVGQNIEFFQDHMLPQIKELMTSVEGATQEQEKSKETNGEV